MEWNISRVFKGITSFIIIFFIFTCIVGIVLNYFYGNITKLNSAVAVNSEYANLNLYFLKITKENDVRISDYGLVDEDSSSSFITFENADGTTNTFIKVGNIIYFNEIKLCENVEQFNINVDTTLKPTIYVQAVISGATYSSQYVILS